MSRSRATTIALAATAVLCVVEVALVHLGRTVRFDPA